MYQKSLSVLLTLFLCLLVAACSSSASKGSRIDYKSTKTLPTLEVPPDLTAPVTDEATLPTESATQAGDVSPDSATVLAEQVNARIKRDGAQRWLEVDMSAEALWPKLRKFWTSSMGLELKVDEPKLGIMETQWAESRVDVPEGYFRGWLAKLKPGRYSVPTRDKYRLRLEPVNENTTELYLSQYGVEQFSIGDADLGQAMWRTRPSDPELASEMLNRLLVFLGVPKEQAEQLAAAAEEKPQARARIELDQEGRPYLVLNENYARAWRHTGIVLDRLGLVVEDRNRSEGIYFIDDTNLLEDAGDGGKSWFKGLFSGDDEDKQGNKLTIILKRDDEMTRIEIQDREGNAIDKNKAEAILTRLRDGLL